jgi:hypothetical protein
MRTSPYGSTRPADKPRLDTLVYELQQSGYATTRDDDWIDRRIGELETELARRPERRYRCLPRLIVLRQLADRRLNSLRKRVREILEAPEED